MIKKKSFQVNESIARANFILWTKFGDNVIHAGFETAYGTSVSLQEPAVGQQSSPGDLPSYQLTLIKVFQSMPVTNAAPLFSTLVLRRM